jgi:SulP family sulfate permease
VLIVRLRRVPFIDITGIQSLEEAVRGLQRRGVRVLLCDANPRVDGKLRRAGIAALLQPGDYCTDLRAALDRIAPDADSAEPR